MLCNFLSDKLDLSFVQINYRFNRMYAIVVLNEFTRVSRRCIHLDPNMPAFFYFSQCSIEIVTIPQAVQKKVLIMLMLNICNVFSKANSNTALFSSIGFHNVGKPFTHECTRVKH